MSGQQYGSDRMVGPGAGSDPAPSRSVGPGWRDSHRVTVPLSILLTLLVAMLVISQVSGGI